MPANKQDTEKKSQLGGDSQESARPEAQMARRTAAFGLAIVVLGIVAVWFVATTFDGQQTENNVTLSAPVEHTVKILEMPERRKGAVKDMLKHPVLRKLTNGHQIYTKSAEGERIALCAGQFDSASSPEALRLLEEIKQFERKGKKPFRSAELVTISVRDNQR